MILSTLQEDTGQWSRNGSLFDTETGLWYVLTWRTNLDGRHLLRDVGDLVRLGVHSAHGGEEGDAVVVFFGREALTVWGQMALLLNESPSSFNRHRDALSAARAAWERLGVELVERLRAVEI